MSINMTIKLIQKKNILIVSCSPCPHPTTYPWPRHSCMLSAQVKVKKSILLGKCAAVNRPHY